MRILILILLICIWISVGAQETWIQELNPIYGVGDVDYFVEDIILSQDGGYVFNGYYTIWDGEFPTDEHWGFLLKTDSFGNLVWIESDIESRWPISDSFAFVETSDNKYLIAGSGYVSVPHLIKRDSNGEMLWTMEYDIFGYSMCNTFDDKIILAGRNENVNLNLRKIDFEANTIWDNSIFTNNVGAFNSVKECSDGSIIGTGFISLSNEDVIVVKANSYGDTLWTRVLDFDNMDDYGTSLTEDLSGNIMVTGYSRPNYTGFFWFLDNNGNTISLTEVDIETGDRHKSIESLQNNTFTVRCVGYAGTKIYNLNSDYSINWESTFDNIWGATGDKSFSKLSDGYIVVGVQMINWEDYFILIKTDSLGQTTPIDDNLIPYLSSDIISNYPNPFNPETNITFTVPVVSTVDLAVFNIRGQRIATILAQEEYLAGTHSVLWRGIDDRNNIVDSGIYFLKLSISGRTDIVKKCLLLK